MNGDQLPTNQLHDIKWGALDLASRAPQLMSCNYYVCACAYGWVVLNHVYYNVKLVNIFRVKRLWLKMP